MLCENILEVMGGTPLVRLRRLVPDDYADVYVKMESLNPGGSHKAKVALSMILAAEADGELRRNSGQTIIEPTGGNTGIGLAMAGSIFGYRIVLVIPDNYSHEKQRVLLGYGATVILSDSAKGPDSHVEKVWELLVEHPDWVFLNQFENRANVDVHKKSTAVEILRDIQRADGYVGGIGTGGSITGIGEALKEHFPECDIIGVQPEGCDILKKVFVPHGIQGLAVGFPTLLNVDIIDGMISVSEQKATETMRRLLKEEGLSVGISSGANVYAAIKLAETLGKGKVVVTIAADSAAAYLDIL